MRTGMHLYMSVLPQTSTQGADGQRYASKDTGYFWTMAHADLAETLDRIRQVRLVCGRASTHPYTDAYT